MCACMFVCTYVYVRVEIETLAYLSRPLQSYRGRSHSFLGTCKHASRPEALCNFQGSVTTYIARKLVKRNLDDGVEAPNGAHSDRSQEPFWGVCRSERRMGACHLRRADWHRWVSFPRETHGYFVDPPVLVACHKPQIGGCVFLNPAISRISRTISHASLGVCFGRAPRLGEAAPLSGPIIG